MGKEQAYGPQNNGNHFCKYRKIFYLDSGGKPTKSQGLISVSICKVILIHRLLSATKMFPLAVMKSIE